MEEIQRFALKNIYSAPAQDKQFRFSMVRVTKDKYPVTRQVRVYDQLRSLPKQNSSFHVFVIGSIPATILNLMVKRRIWTKNTWKNVQTDMNDRNFIMQFYDCDGVTYPRANFYYMVGRDDELIIAVEMTDVIRTHFNVENCAYMRVYSNEFFNTYEFDMDNPNREVGIYVESMYVRNNIDKLYLQNKVTDLEEAGGSTLVYVNGYLTDRVRLDIEDDSVVEVVYDKSILGVQSIPISDLRTFHSNKDNRVKFLLYRDRDTDSIQYEDDLEVYVTGSNDSGIRGLYYYQHKHYALTNVTDKDFALDTNFVNTHSSILSSNKGMSIVDNEIRVYCRRSSVNRKLVYSSLKLHEFYKLPHDVQRDLLNNVNNTMAEFRVEYLEDSSYFKVASANSLKEITKELASDAVGYNGVKYYYGYSPQKVTDVNMDVPFLYRTPSLAYEYSQGGRLLGYYPTVGPSYPVANEETKYVEFLQGRNVEDFKLLSTYDSVILKDAEYRVLSAYFTYGHRATDWEDVTGHPGILIEGNKLTITDPALNNCRVVYVGDLLLRDLEVEFVDGQLAFFIEVDDDKGDGVYPDKLDVPFDALEVFLNGYRLAYGIDFEIDFPNVAICTKKYIDYTLDKQQVHVRLTGFNTDPKKVNSREIKGFVHHGALTRNNYYDIRDDKVFSIFVDGRLVDRDTVNFSEEDNTVRIEHPLNGVPYTISEYKVSIQPVTGLPTDPLFEKDRLLNNKISELFNVIYPEPEIDGFLVIQDHHYLFSTLTAKIIHDLLEGNISPSVYTRPYNDNVIQELIRDNYQFYYDMDPVHKDFPKNVVEIHPHSGNGVIEVSLLQYRFISNVIRVITGGHPEKINLSGYLSVNTEIQEREVSEDTTPGGVLIL